MSKELEITTKFCSSQAGVADSNCNDVILKNHRQRRSSFNLWHFQVMKVKIFQQKTL